MTSSKVLRPFVSLKRLRLGFLLVGTLLLFGLGLLSVQVRERLEEARLEREQMVASRVFDELEREVSAFLEGESERPPYAGLAATDPASWAPFVVGYYKKTGADVELVAADGTTSENRRRVLWALSQLEAVAASTKGREPSAIREEAPAPVPSLAPAPAGQTSAQSTFTKPEALPPIAGNASPAPVSPKEASGPGIIEQLNRAPERRMQKKTASPKPGAAEDQFMDYEGKF